MYVMHATASATPDLRLPSQLIQYGTLVVIAPAHGGMPRLSDRCARIKTVSYRSNKAVVAYFVKIGGKIS